MAASLRRLVGLYLKLARGSSGSKGWTARFSRDHRSDHPQVVIGLLTTAEGIPIAHHVLAGNTANVSTLPRCWPTSEHASAWAGSASSPTAAWSRPTRQALETRGFSHVLATRLHGDPACAAALEASSRRDAVWVPVPDAPRRPATCRVNGRRYVVAASFERWQHDTTRTTELMASTEETLRGLERRVHDGELVDAAKIGRAASASLRGGRRSPLRRSSRQCSRPTRPGSIAAMTCGWWTSTGRSARGRRGRLYCGWDSSPRPTQGAVREPAAVSHLPACNPRARCRAGPRRRRCVAGFFAGLVGAHGRIRTSDARFRLNRAANYQNGCLRAVASVGECCGVPVNNRGVDGQPDGQRKTVQLTVRASNLRPDLRLCRIWGKKPCVAAKRISRRPERGPWDASRGVPSRSPLYPTAHVHTLLLISVPCPQPHLRILHRQIAGRLTCRRPSHSCRDAVRRRELSPSASRLGA